MVLSSFLLRLPARRHPPGGRRFVTCLASAALVAGWGCDGSEPRDTTPYRSEVDEGLGIAVAIVVDNSGSMEDPAANDDRPKYEVARAAIGDMLAATESFVASHPEMPVKVALFRFAGDVQLVMPMQPCDRIVVQQAVGRIPALDGATAIGNAMQAARGELYRSGVFRKHLVVITDGENTSGREPAEEALEIHQRSERSVRMHFVAFDTDPEKFGFLEEVDGQVLAAADAAALRESLEDLYRRQILAEAIDELEPATPR